MRMNFNKYFYKVYKKLFKALYKKFMRVGDPRGELSIFEAQAKLSFYISSIILFALLALILFFIAL